MPGIRIVTDSACDLDPDVTLGRGIDVVPLTIRFGTEEFVDRVDMSTSAFWDRLKVDVAAPETAAPSPGAFRDVFLAAADSGADGIACITLSSGLSATHLAARAAAETVADHIPVRIIDSLSVTMGLGLLVLAAADAAGENRTLEEIEAELIDLRARTRVFGMVESLEYLRRGGRIGGAQAFLGSLMSIKPIIEVRGGKVEAESRQRTRSRALAYLASKAVNAGRLERIAMAASVSPDADRLHERLESADCDRPVVVGELGPVVGSHAGPGTIGVAYQIGACP